MWIFKKIFEWLAKFFGSKAGKTTAKAMAGVGLGAGIAAGSEMVFAHQRNKRAEAIKDRAIKKHDEGRAKVEGAMAELGETKLQIYKSFGQLADAIEIIQQRPDYELCIEGIELPSFQPAEFKQLSMAVEAAAGGSVSMMAGSAVGVAAMGTGTILAMTPGVLLGGVVLCAMGAKMLHRSAENVKIAKKIESDVDAILVYYKELDKTVKRFHKVFLEVKEPYIKHLRKVQKVIDRKTDWEKFSKAERLTVKNTIALAQLLRHMCDVDLVLKAPKKDELERVNTHEVDHVIADAGNMCEKLRKGVAI